MASASGRLVAAWPSSNLHWPRRESREFGCTVSYLNDSTHGWRLGQAVQVMAVVHVASKGSASCCSGDPAIRAGSLRFIAVVSPRSRPADRMMALHQRRRSARCCWQRFGWLRHHAAIRRRCTAFKAFTQRILGPRVVNLFGVLFIGDFSGRLSTVCARGTSCYAHRQVLGNGVTAAFENGRECSGITSAMWSRSFW